MNKSKFLKKSLAALLAILMVVAVIPLSAAASEESTPTPEPTPEPVALLAPTVTVNNRNAEKPENAEGSYSATVEDATTVSIAWVPETDVTAKLRTKREVEVTLPFYRLDLTQEGDLVNYDKDTKIATYQVTLIFQKGEEEAVEYPLVITSRTEAASDDVTLKSVKANQSFQIGSDTYTFSGISGDFTGDEEITITLPLGWDGKDAGFDSTTFGGTVGTGANVDAMTDAQARDQLVSRVFVPTASYSTVQYKSTGTLSDMTGRVTVTARDGRSKNYTVKFVQEAALDEVQVKLWKGVDDTKTFDATSTYVDSDNNLNYVVPVETEYYNYTKNNPAGGVVSFGHGDNVVRVEDPSTTTAGNYAGNEWDPTATAPNISEDEPVLSGKNIFVFNTNQPTSDAAAINGIAAYMTVKTEANMATNSANVDAMEDGTNNGKFYANVRIVLVDTNDQAVAPTGAPKLYELQLNGYESIWNKGNELGTLDEKTGLRKITVNVDNEFKYGNGDDVHPARISLKATSGAEVSIPAQAADSGVNPYWVVDPVTATGGRIGKPSDAVHLDNVNVEGRSFVLRVADPADAKLYTEYLITIKQPTKNEGTNIPKARLWYYNTTTKAWTSYEATKSATGNNFQFELPDALYNMDVVGGSDPAIGAVTGTKADIVGANGTGAVNGTDAIQVELAITGTDAFKEAVKTAIANDADINTIELGLTHANNATSFSLVATTKKADSTTIASHTVATVEVQNPAALAYDVKVGGTTVGTVTFSGEYWDGANSTAIAAAQMTAANFNTWFGNNTKPEGWSVGYTPGVAGTPSMKSAFKGCFLDLDVPHGAVVTPGASGKTLNADTTIWGADQYSGYPTTAGSYNELEEGYTTIGNWWIGKYLRHTNNSQAYASADAANGGVNTDWLYFTVTNGRPTGNAKTEVYSIRLIKKGSNTPGSSNSTDATLKFGSATSAVDEDLVYGGNSVTDSILNQSNTANPGAVVQTAVALAGTWGKFIGTNNDGSITYSDAKYVGAVNENNTYKVTEGEDPNNGKAKVITIEVPESFTGTTTGGTNDFNSIVFDSITVPVGAQAFIGNNGGSGFYDVTTVLKSGRTLNSLDQSKNGVRGFVFAEGELGAWNGNTFVSANVSPLNTIYVFSQKTATDNHVTNAATAFTNRAKADAIYYITVKRIADKTADTLQSVSATSTNGQVTAYVNHSRKVVTVNVPYSYNWIGSRDTEDYDFTLDFTVDSGATLVDAYRDTAFNFRKQGPTNIWSVPQNFKLADLVQQQQDLFSLSDKNLTYFVKGGELFVFNKNTGSETQITGMGNGVDDAFINRAWGLIKTREAELRVYPETRANVNTYKLELNINDPESEARITGVMVDETEAVIDEATRTIVAPMPEGYVPSDVRLSISVSGMTKIVSVNKAPYDPNSGNRYDLREPIEIVIAPEDGGAEITYTLTAKTEAEPTAEPSADPTEEPTAEPSADPSEEPSVEPSATPDIAKNYTDLDKVSSDDMRKEVVTALNLGLMNGTTPTTFAPKLTMKRYQFALVIARADLIAKDKDVTGENVDEKLVEMYPESYNFTFKDVSEKVELPAAAAAVQYCYDKGYVDGTDLAKGLFSPNAPILREQAAKIMVGWAGLDHDDTDLSDIPDGDKVSDWAKGYVKAAYEAEIIKGRANGDFDPRTALKREEGACLMVRTYEKYILNGEDNEPTPTPEPTETPEPTSEPTEEPDPTAEPTEEPTAEPTVDPTEEPTAEPTAEPTVDPTEEPTAEPSTEPSTKPAE